MVICILSLLLFSSVKQAHVIVGVRDINKSQSIINEFKQANLNNIEFNNLDLSSLVSIKSFSDRFNNRKIALNLLINNAGVMGCPLSYTSDGFEMQIGTNHIGHFYLTKLLLPALLQAKSARVVNLASSGHKWLVIFIKG